MPCWACEVKKMSCSGVVKTWKISRGYGFITPDDGAEDIFIHVKNILDDGSHPRSHLNIGEKVTYDVFTDNHTRKERASKCRGDGSGATPHEEEEGFGRRGGGRSGGGYRDRDDDRGSRGGGYRDDRRSRGGDRDDRRGGGDRDRRGGGDRDRRSDRDSNRGGGDRDRFNDRGSGRDDRRGGGRDDRSGGRDRRERENSRGRSDRFENRDQQRQRSASPARRRDYSRSSERD